MKRLMTVAAALLLSAAFALAGIPYVVTPGGMGSNLVIKSSLLTNATIRAADGSGITNIHGTTGIQALTINSNRFDAGTAAQLALAGTGGSGTGTNWTDAGGASLTGISNITASGTVSAAGFAGDGNGLTNINLGDSYIQSGTLSSNAFGATAIEFIQAAGGGSGEYATNSPNGTPLNDMQYGSAALTNLASGDGAGLTSLSAPTIITAIDVHSGVGIGTNSIRGGGNTGGPLNLMGEVDEDGILVRGPVSLELAGYSFNGSGSGLSNLNASFLESGTVPVGRLPTNSPVAWAGTNINVGDVINTGTVSNRGATYFGSTGKAAFTSDGQLTTSTNVTARDFAVTINGAGISRTTGDQLAFQAGGHTILASKNSLRMFFDSDNDTTTAEFSVSSNNREVGGNESRILVLTESGNMSLAGTITATNFIGSGAGLTNLVNLQYGSVALTNLASGDGQGLTNLNLSSPVLDEGSWNFPLDIPTYDGVPMANHPSVIDFRTNWNGFRYWMAFTPYPDYGRENPSIVCSHDGIRWVVPANVVNPIFTHYEATNASALVDTEYDYAGWSDSFIMCVTNRMIMIGRMNSYSTNGGAWYAKVSDNGTNWSALQLLFTYTPNNNFQCPIGIDLGNGVIRWYGLIGDYLRHFTSDYDLTMNTNSWVNCSLGLWHFDITRTASGEYWCLNARSTGNASGTPLDWYRSSDGTTWTNAAVDAVKTSGYEWDSQGYYKPTFVINSENPPNITLWAGSAMVGSTLEMSFQIQTNRWRIGRMANIGLPWTNRFAPRFGILSTDKVTERATMKFPTVSPVTLEITNAGFSTVYLPTGSVTIVHVPHTDSNIVQRQTFYFPTSNDTRVVTWPSAWTWTGGSPPTNIDTNECLVDLLSVGFKTFATAHIISNVWGGWNSDAGAYFAATGITNFTTRAAINSLVNGLQANGFWDSEVALYPFAGATAAAHAVNLRNPGTYNLTYTNSNLSHGVNGMTGGASSYANTGLTPSTASLTNSNIRCFVYIHTPATAATHYYGAASESTNRVYISRSNANVVDHRFSDDYTSMAYGQLGSLFIQHTNSTTRNFCQTNNSFSTTTGLTQTPLPSLPIYLLAYNNGGSAQSYCDATMCGFSIGNRALTPSEYVTYYNLWQTYQLAMGRAKP